MLKTEINIPPSEFQSRLILLGGVNRYDEPNFRLAWAQYETFIAGGVWSVDESYFQGYRQLLSSTGEPCWSLYQWHDASEYGSPESYYIANYDSNTGLQTLGEYPYSGRYELLYNLRFNEIINNRIEFFAMPLATPLLELIIPVILAAKNVSYERRRAAYLDHRAKLESERLNEIERHLRDSEIPYLTGVSYSRQGIRSALIDRKVIEMQRSWQDATAAARRFRKGLQTSEN